jgi:hypothetical protein
LIQVAPGTVVVYPLILATVLDEKQVLMYMGCSMTVHTTQTLDIGSLNINPMLNARVGSPKKIRFMIFTIPIMKACV